MSLEFLTKLKALVEETVPAKDVDDIYQGVSNVFKVKAVSSQQDAKKYGQIFSQVNPIKQKHTKHGDTGTPLYKTWTGINSRTKVGTGNPNYTLRGIEMCPEWSQNYPAFKESILRTIGDKPGQEYSLDRIDNNDIYKEGNVRWATSAQQNSNKSNTINLMYEGVTKSLKQWSIDLGISYDTLYYRHARGKTPAEILDISHLNREDRSNGTTG